MGNGREYQIEISIPAQFSSMSPCAMHGDDGRDAIHPRARPYRSEGRSTLSRILTINPD